MKVKKISFPKLYSEILAGIICYDPSVMSYPYFWKSSEHKEEKLHCSVTAATNFQMNVLSLSLCLSGQSTLLAKERFHFFSSPILGYYYLLLIMHSTSSCGLPHSVSLQNILLTTFAGLSTEFDSFAPNLQQIATCIAKLRQTCLLSVNIATELQVYTNFIANNNCKRFCRLLQLPNLPYQNLSIL